MSTRIIKFMGYGFGETDATIKVTFDGTEIYNGPVPTTSGLIPDLPDDQYNAQTVTLFTEESTPISFSGTKSMTCEVTDGTVLFAQVLSNYMGKKMFNPVYSAGELATLNDPAATRAEKLAIMSPHAVPPFSAADESVILTSSDYNAIQAVMAAHGCSLTLDSGADNYYSVSTSAPNGDYRRNVTLDGVPVTSELGAWWWLVEQGSTLAYDLQIDAGAE